MAMEDDVPALQGIRPGGKDHPIDRILQDGDQVKLGDMTLTALLTPGHTNGCTSWTIKVQEGGRTYDVLIIGSMGVNNGTNLVGNPARVEQYRQSFKVLHAQHVDVPLGSHPAMYNMVEKHAKLTAGGPNPYIDPKGYQDELTIQETAFNNELKRQETEGPPHTRWRAAARSRTAIEIGQTGWFGEGFEKVGERPVWPRFIHFFAA